MVRRRPPETEEGWYALHDLRRIDWDAWRDAPEPDRARALEEGIAYLRAHEAVEDADEGGSAVFSILGHEADLLVLHLRPTLAHLDRAERRFESTALARFTDRTDSYVSVTEVSGYMHDDLDEGLDAVEDAGMRNYMRQRIYPDIPEAAHVCFYPMDKRRDPEYNWYDLPFEERAAHMSAHGEVGREYAGRVTQIITGSVGLDDHEWGVTLFADDPTDIKHLLYEMRFDPSSSRFAEFGSFYVGRRFPPSDLDSLFAGDVVPTDEPMSGDEMGANESTGDEMASDESEAHVVRSDAAAGHADRGDVTADEATHVSSPARADSRPGHDESPHEEIDADEFERRVFRYGVDLDDHPGAGYGLLFGSDADAEALVDDVEGLRANFEHYDTHVLTSVRADSGDTAVISLWANERAANTASGFLADLPGAGPGVGASLEAGTEADAETDAQIDAEVDPESVDESVTESELETGTHGTGGDEAAAVRDELADLDVYAGQPHGEDVYAMVLYSEAAPEALAEQFSTLRGRFENDDGHVKSALYTEAADGDRSAIVSIWEDREAAERAGSRLADLPGVVERAGEADIGGPGSGESGFGTMGMFYTVKPEHREAFVETFEEVGEALADMEGHLDTRLFVNVDDENDTFIASQWREKDDALAFFRSEAFRQTVRWGREVLADRPRHVFLA